MSQFAANNPLTRKLQQEAAKKVTKFVSDQAAKHGPKVIEAGKSFANGARGPVGQTPVKNTTTNKVANEAGGLARDIATDKPKKDFEAKGKQVINSTAAAVQNKLNQPAKPTAGTPAMKPGMLNKPGMPNINKLNQPMKPMMNVPNPALNKPAGMSKPLAAAVKTSMSSVKIPKPSFDPTKE